MADQPTVRRGRGSWRWALAVGVAGVTAAGVLAPVPAGAVAPSADLSVEVSHAPDSVRSTEEITFTITAHNAGPDAAAAVVAGLGFDYPLQYVSADDGCSRSSANNSVICNLGDLASGGSASAVVVVKAYNSGVYTVPGVVSSPTADPDAADRQTTDSIIIQKGLSQAERYLRGIVPGILDRPADASLIAFWGPRWKAAYAGYSYPRTLWQIPLGIMGSNEYRRLRVNQAFQKVFGRDADPANLTSYVNRSKAGWTYEQIERQLMTTPEFDRRAGADQWTDPEIVDRIYQVVLGRAPTAAERTKGIAMLGRGYPWAERPALIRSVQHTTEAYDRILNQQWTEAVGSGSPSPLSRYVWQYGVRNGKSPERLWADILVGNEVLNKYPFTEDDYSELYPEYDFTEVKPLG